MSELKKNLFKLCDVPQCKKRQCGSVSFYQFPSDEKLKKKWLKALKMQYTTPGMRICHRHFLKSDFFPTSNYFYKVLSLMYYNNI